MQYFKELPEVTYQGMDKDSNIELEVNGHVEPIHVEPEVKDEDIVFTGRMGGTIYLIIGKVVEYEYIEPEESASGHDFTRLKIEGTIVTVF